MDVRDKLLTENPWKLMLHLSLPAILGQLIVGLYAFVDSIYVGQMVGTDAMSAVSAASFFVLVNNVVVVLLSIGLCIYDDCPGIEWRLSMKGKNSLFPVTSSADSDPVEHSERLQGDRPHYFFMSFSVPHFGV